MTDTITICAGCHADGEKPQGKALARSLRPLLGGKTNVNTTDCMNTCGHPTAVAFRAPGKPVYLFHNVDPATQTQEIADFAKAYATEKGGIVTDARPFGQLRFCLVGRVPG